MRRLAFVLVVACENDGGTPVVTEPTPVDPVPSVDTVATGDTGEATSSTAPFVATFTSERLGPAMAIRSNLPYANEACLALVGAPCGDIDQDGLTDAWEDGILDRVRPAVEFDEAEQRVDDATAVLAMVARVVPVVDRIHVYVMIGYDLDYGRCGLSGHDGDSERVAVSLAPMAGEGPGDVAFVGAYTAAHEGTIGDEGRVYDSATLGELSFPADPTDGTPRWRVFSSDGKHATYGTLDHCESTSVVPCVEEDCGADGVDPAAYRELPPIWNAGEPELPRLSDLGPIGFPGEDAWAAQDFCGGRGRGLLCASPVVEKLTVDPF
jgi:hypothetical protein